MIQTVLRKERRKDIKKEKGKFTQCLLINNYRRFTGSAFIFGVQQSEKTVPNILGLLGPEDGGSMILRKVVTICIYQSARRDMNFQQKCYENVRYHSQLELST
jgi:hypothetical protein